MPFGPRTILRAGYAPAGESDGWTLFAKDVRDASGRLYEITLRVFGDGQSRYSRRATIRMRLDGREVELSPDLEETDLSPAEIESWSASMYDRLECEPIGDDAPGRPGGD